MYGVLFVCAVNLQLHARHRACRHANLFRDSGLSGWLIEAKSFQMSNNWPAGPMARRLTTNQEIAGSTPASVISFLFF